MTSHASLLDLVPVIPVVVVKDVADAVPIAEALVRGGLPVIELTLRTPAALDAIKRIATEVPDIMVGAGTIVDTSQPKQAAAAGAQFLVSPGSTPTCGRPCATQDYRTFPVLPRSPRCWPCSRRATPR